MFHSQMLIVDSTILTLLTSLVNFVFSVTETASGDIEITAIVVFYQLANRNILRKHERDIVFSVCAENVSNQ